MSDFYQAFFHLKGLNKTLSTIQHFHELIRDYGAEIDEDSMLILNDVENDEPPEPEYIHNIGEAIRKIASWQTLGLMSYGMPQEMVDVIFHKQNEAKDVQCIKLCFMEGAMDRAGEEKVNWYVNLMKRIHIELKAMRTVFDWALESRGGYEWVKERKLFLEGNMRGTYWLDILNAEFVTEQRILSLKRRKNGDSRLEILFEGSLLFQWGKTFLDSDQILFN